MLKHSGLDGLFAGADNLADLLAVLEQDERRHGADAELLRYVRHIVHVEFVETHVGVLVGQFGNVRGDRLAWAAPGGETIDKQWRMVRDGGLVFLFATRVTEELVWSN